jgi:hypothetical protein
LRLALVLVAAMCICGCQSYQYRILHPQVTPSVVSRQQQVSLKVDPLEYRLSEESGRLAMRIFNPTADQLLFLGDRSFVTDPDGQSRQIRNQVLGPNSFIQMLLPPVPFTFARPAYGWGWGWSTWGWDWGWGWPGYGPYYWGGFYGPPPMVYDQVLTSYDWTWRRGPIRLRLVFARGGGATFEHEFQFDREPVE